jgi:hypothetical protein
VYTDNLTPLTFFLPPTLLPSRETLGVAHFYTLERIIFYKILHSFRGLEARDTAYSDFQNFKLSPYLEFTVQVAMISDSCLSSKSKFNLTWSCLGQNPDGNRPAAGLQKYYRYRFFQFQFSESNTPDSSNSAYPFTKAPKRRAAPDLMNLGLLGNPFACRSLAP